MLKFKCLCVSGIQITTFYILYTLVFRDILCNNYNAKKNINLNE